MKVQRVIEKSHKFAKPFRVTNGRKFRLKDIDPGDTLGLGSEDKPRAREALAVGTQALAELPDKLYAMALLHPFRSSVQGAILHADSHRHH